MAEEYLDANKKPIQEGVYQVNNSKGKYEVEIYKVKNVWTMNFSSFSCKLTPDEAKKCKFKKSLADLVKKEEFFDVIPFVETAITESKN